MSKAPLTTTDLAELFAAGDQPITADDEALDQIAVARYMLPDCGRFWYALEASPITDRQGEPVDVRLYVYEVHGDYREFRHIAMSDFRAIRSAWGLPVIKDWDFTPRPLREIPDAHLPRWSRQFQS